MRKQKALTWIAVVLGVLVLLLMNHTEGFVNPTTTKSTPHSPSAHPVHLAPAASSASSDSPAWQPTHPDDGTPMTPKEFWNCIDNPKSAGCHK